MFKTGLAVLVPFGMNSGDFGTQWTGRKQMEDLTGIRDAQKKPEESEVKQNNQDGRSSAIASDLASGKGRGVVKTKQLLKLLERQKFRCGLTGQPLTPETSSVDHIVPVSQGGSDELDNLMWVRTDANRAKGTLSLQEFLHLCRLVAAYHGSGR